MPIENHKAFQPPADENSRLWRYMDFTKFVSLLDTRALYFACVTMMEDPYEGVWSRASVEAVRREVEALYTKYPTGVPDASLEGAKSAKFYAVLAFHHRREVAVNCWHLNEGESAAMWKLYGTEGKGIAIQSTYRRLVDSFAATDSPFYAGKMRYIDYASEQIPGGNTYHLVMHKRRSFQHENEFRVVTRCEPDTGKLVGIDLDRLVECVCLSPETPGWVEELVRSLMKRLGLSARIEKSQLYAFPSYGDLDSLPLEFDDHRERPAEE